MVYLYNKIKPDLNEITLVKIVEINDLNIVASLIDYNNLTGYISYSEVSKKKRYKLNKIVHVNKEIIVQITGFNNAKNYAELSIRALNDTDISNFTSNRKKYIALYNLWRYVYMKLNPELEMDITKIIDEQINDFMKKTLWKIEENYEEFNTELIYNSLLNVSENLKIIEHIIDYDLTQIKNILDGYIELKVIPVKKSKIQEFTAYSYELDGLSDLKSALNFKSYDKFIELSNKYEINITYLADKNGNKYLLSIKQRKPLEEDINQIYQYIVDEIKKRCDIYKIIFNI